MRVSGKFALVTGAAQGIGKAISIKLLESEAAGVCLVDCNRERLEVTTEELKDKFPGAAVCCFVADLQVIEQHEGAFAYAVQQFGKLHIVANNAGVVDEESPERVAAVNLVVPYRGSLLGLRYLSRLNPGGEGGVIINTGSTLGLMISPEMCFYAATKHGVIALTRALAVDERFAGSGVRLSCICPHATDTEMIRMNISTVREELAQQIVSDLLKPTQVADAFVQLIGDDDANGKVMRIDPPGRVAYYEFADHVVYGPPAPGSATAQ